MLFRYKNSLCYQFASIFFEQRQKLIIFREVICYLKKQKQKQQQQQQQKNNTYKNSVLSHKIKKIKLGKYKLD